MRPKALLPCSMCLVGLFGCISPVEKPTSNVRLGMSADEISFILGDPSRRASRAENEVWRYEDIINWRQCERDTYNCRHSCNYVSVWFQNDVVIALTSRRVSNLSDCGKGMEPVDWRLLPNYAFLCHSPRRRLAESSEVCVGQLNRATYSGNVS